MKFSGEPAAESDVEEVVSFLVRGLNYGVKLLNFAEDSRVVRGYVPAELAEDVDGLFTMAIGDQPSGMVLADCY